MPRLFVALGAGFALALALSWWIPAMAYVMLAFALASVVVALAYNVAAWSEGVQKIVVAWKAAPRRNRVIFGVTVFVLLAITAAALSLVPWSRLWAGYSAMVGSRSEEHTSELQSLAYLVCRLLLEKKNKSVVNVPTNR